MTQFISLRKRFVKLSLSDDTETRGDPESTPAEQQAETPKPAPAPAEEKSDKKAAAEKDGDGSK